MQLMPSVEVRCRRCTKGEEPLAIVYDVSTPSLIDIGQYLPREAIVRYRVKMSDTRLEIMRAHGETGFVEMDATDTAKVSELGASLIVWCPHHGHRSVKTIDLRSNLDQSRRTGELRTVRT